MNLGVHKLSCIFARILGLDRSCIFDYILNIMINLSTFHHLDYYIKYLWLTKSYMNQGQSLGLLLSRNMLKNIICH